LERWPLSVRRLGDPVADGYYRLQQFAGLKERAEYDRRRDFRTQRLVQSSPVQSPPQLSELLSWIVLVNERLEFDHFGSVAPVFVAPEYVEVGKTLTLPR
jgi:hypothetical protein